ncbi:MAG TPA: nicotinate-nucleotide adenylyltransferase [Pyrinomonadaceae bacterium]|nr:nicotinate-nucleotide adenylyltransferase [Pyrinomonadaceae bacterium]
MQKRIAIYGGTFDPVHAGHLEIARAVTQLFEIDEFLFVPARQAPHKQDAQVSSAIARYAMLALATQDDARFRVSTVELESGATQYTVDTLQQFRGQLEETAELFFVMGADSWMEITSWREWKRLLALSNHIVVTRPGYDFSADHVGSTVAARVADVRGQESPRISGLVETGKPKIFVTDAVMRDVSATAVRRAVRENRVGDLSKLTTPAVAQYITKYRLYRNTNEG